MNESKKCLTESISALVDSEVSELELHRVLKDLDAEQLSEHPLLDDSSAGKWCRYNLISHSMAETSLGFSDISAAVSKAIDREEAHGANPVRASLHALSFSALGRFAVAASVAMVAILGVQQFNAMDPVRDKSFDIAEMGIQSAEQAQGPAIQFPADFRPVVEARSVSAGGKIKTSQHPVLVRVTNSDRQPVDDRQVRSFLSEILEIHSINESDLGIPGMLPFARHIEVGEEIGIE